VQSIGDSAEHGYRWVSLSTLDRAEITKVQAGAERQLLLRDAASLPHFADRGPNGAFPSHDGIGALVAMQGLGHICPQTLLECPHMLLVRLN